jgi:hypothetical protein
LGRFPLILCQVVSDIVAAENSISEMGELLSIFAMENGSALSVVDNNGGILEVWKLLEQK